MKKVWLFGFCSLLLLLGSASAFAQSLEDFNSKMSETLLLKKRVTPGLLKQWRIRFRSELNSFSVLARKASDPKAQELQKLAWYLAFAEFVAKSSSRSLTDQMLKKYFDLDYRRDNEFEKKFFEDIAKIYGDRLALDFLESLYSLFANTEIPMGGTHFVGYYCSKLGYIKKAREYEECRRKQIEFATQKGAGFEYIKRVAIVSLLRFYSTPPLQLEKFRDLMGKTLAERDATEDLKDELRALAFYAEIGFGDKERALAFREIIREKSADDDRKSRVEYFFLFSESRYEAARKLFDKALLRSADAPLLSKISDLQFGAQLYYRLGEAEKARQLAQEWVNLMGDSEVLLRIHPLMILMALNHFAGQPAENKDYIKQVSDIKSEMTTLRIQSRELKHQVAVLEILLGESLTSKDKKKLKELIQAMKGQHPTYSNPLEILENLLEATPNS